MITVSIQDLILLILTLGGMLILSAFVTGWLIYRAKRESHERLFPAKPRKKSGPKNIDEFAPEEEEPGLPDAIAIHNRVFGQRFGVDSLKGEKK